MHVAYLAEARVCQAAVEGTDGGFFVRAFEFAQCDAGLYVGPGHLTGNMTERGFQLFHSQGQQESLVPLDIKSISPHFTRKWASWPITVKTGQRKLCQAIILPSAQDPDYVALLPLEYLCRNGSDKTTNDTRGLPHQWLLHPLPAFPPELTPAVLPLSQLQSALANLRAFAQGSGLW